MSERRRASTFSTRQFSTDSTACINFTPHLRDFIFDLYRSADSDSIEIPHLLKSLYESGIRKDDPRLCSFLRLLPVEGRTESVDDDVDGGPAYGTIDRETFKRCVGDSIGIIGKALKKQLIIPDWRSFCNIIGGIFEGLKTVDEGKVANYIPQLARSDPNLWAVSICTIDGQRRSWGDSKIPFCLQSVSKPFTYAIALEEYGADKVHKYVGQEPSGRLFNEICLDHNHKPHNPMINAGAIIVASLLRPDVSPSDRFEFAMQYFKKFTAGGRMGFNNSVFLSERESADRNYALGYYMREHKCFPPESNMKETLDLYFQLCSVETDAETLAVMAATLANGGVSPLTEQRILSNRSVRDTLSLMYSCGMYDYSGQFAFRVGLPAKSGVSGDMIIVIPNVMGICIYSPRLDSLGNTVRGVRFAEQLIEKFNFHNYDSLAYAESHKIDPRKHISEVRTETLSSLMYAVKAGDLSAVRRNILLGANIHDRDYDERTVLHVAASEGHSDILEFLLRRWNEPPDPVDRHGLTPLDEARSFGHTICVDMITKSLAGDLGHTSDT